MSREKSGGLSVTTLLIASASAAAAALIIPLFWDKGSLVAAAITPIIVALTSEALKKPVEKVQTVGVWRRTPQGTAVRQPAGRDFEVHDPEEERFEIAPERTDDPFGLREPERPAFLTRKRVVLALTTGALAFGIAAVVVTASELAIFGDSVSRPNRTTFFGGTERERATPTPTPTPAATEEGEEATPTPTPTATPSATATPEATQTPGATPAPNSAAPAPGATPAPTP
jgi:hypothetical protein